MNPIKILEILAELRMLPFFPNDECVMNGIVRLVGAMCASEEQVRWLVSRMTSGIYEQWPGPREMRACFCNRYKPKDGINAYSTIYPDGLPIDPTAPPRPEIAAPKLKALPAGHAVTADPELEASIQKLAEKCKMPAPHWAVTRFGQMLKEIQTPPDKREPEEPRPTNPNYKRITEADVAAAVAENRAREARKAKGEEEPAAEGREATHGIPGRPN
jgi:hypothetical protein